MADARLVFELALVHYIPSTVYNTGPVGSRFDCADRCFYNGTCATMIYDMDNRDCYFYKGKATLEESFGYPLNISIIMFNTNRNLCNDSLTSDIPDSPFTASSQWDGYHGPNRARLHTQHEGAKQGAWSSRTKDANQWLQVHLLRLAQVRTVTTQGRNVKTSCVYPCGQWVTKYTVEYSVDGTTWTSLTDETGVVQMFNGNTDIDTPVTNSLGDQVIARFVRIRPQEWYGHPSMRVDVNGCYVDPCPVSEGYTWDETLAVCYKYHSTVSVHADAVDTCTEEGANGLLRIDTVQRKEFFVSLYASSQTWVDGNKVDGQWVYWNGDAMVSELWNRNEPNGDGACTEILGSGLNDKACSNLRAFICEIHV